VRCHGAQRLQRSVRARLRKRLSASRDHLLLAQVYLGTLEALQKGEEGRRGMNPQCVPRRLDRTGEMVDAAGRVAAEPSPLIPAKCPADH